MIPSKNFEIDDYERGLVRGFEDFEGSAAYLPKYGGVPDHLILLGHTEVAGDLFVQLYYGKGEGSQLKQQVRAYTMNGRLCLLDGEEEPISDLALLTQMAATNPLDFVSTARTLRFNLRREVAEGTLLERVAQLDRLYLSNKVNISSSIRLLTGLADFKLFLPRGWKHLTGEGAQKQFKKVEPFFF